MYTPTYMYMCVCVHVSVHGGEVLVTSDKPQTGVAQEAHSDVFHKHGPLRLSLDLNTGQEVIKHHVCFCWDQFSRRTKG